MQHPRQRHVGGEERLAACPCKPVDTSRRSADDVEGAGRPLLERVLLDDEEDLLVPALDLCLCADQSRHVRIASSIFGYVPQRQMFPAMRWRISSVLGSGVASTRATAETIWPGVQKPH